MAESVLVKHQLQILNRGRKWAPNLRATDRIIVGLRANFMRRACLLSSAITLKPSTLLHLQNVLKKRKYRMMSLLGGKQVVNFVITGAPDKGQALVSERSRLRCKWALFVGDDENDEDAFASGGNIVAIRVGQSRRSHAPYYIRSQAEIDELLALLVSLRTGTTVRV